MIKLSLLGGICSLLPSCNLLFLFLHLNISSTVPGFLAFCLFNFSIGAGFSKRAFLHICICLYIVEHVNKNVYIQVRSVEMSIELAINVEYFREIGLQRLSLNSEDGSRRD